MSRSESVVVCDLRSVVVALITSRGFGNSFVGIWGAGVLLLEGASDDW